MLRRLGGRPLRCRGRWRFSSEMKSRWALSRSWMMSQLAAWARCDDVEAGATAREIVALDAMEEVVAGHSLTVSPPSSCRRMPDTAFDAATKMRSAECGLPDR